jgi:type II secretory pathway component PulF
MAVIVQIMVGTTRRRPQLVQLYLALLTYLIAPTIAVVIGGLIVAIVTGAWRP